MSSQGYQQTLVAALADGTALTASTTPTSLLLGTASHAKFTIPAGFLERPGQVLKITAQGRITTVVTTPGTLTLDVRLGAVIAANGGAMALNVVAKVGVPWYLEWMLTVRSVGNGTLATLMHQGLWTSEAVVGAPLPSAGGASTHMLPNATPAVGTGFDSTAAQTVDLFATWSINNANSIQIHQYKLESLN